MRGVYQSDGGRDPAEPDRGWCLRLWRALWYILNMREWMRARMRRRSKRGPNNSESTGKIGQELPQNQPAPLQPNYAGPDFPAAADEVQAEVKSSSGKERRESQRGREQSPREQSPREQSPREQSQRRPPVIGSDLEQTGRTSDASADGAPTERAPANRAPADQSGSRAEVRERREGGREARGRERADAPLYGAEPVQPSTSAEAARPTTETSAPETSAPETSAPEGKLVVETQPESPSLPPPEVVGSPRPSRGFVVLTIGLPGSGKTTWFKRRGVTPLSSDMLRSILFDDIGEQRYQGLVFSTLRSLLRARLIAKMPWNYVDATNLSPHERRQWIKMAKSFGYEVQAVFFDVPFEVCMERNLRRERTLSDEAMRKMAERLRPPSFKEGFSKITLVRVKGQPAPTPESAMSAPVPLDIAPDEGDVEPDGYLEGEEA
jgi:predicted kinase